MTPARKEMAKKRWISLSRLASLVSGSGVHCSILAGGVKNREELRLLPKMYFSLSFNLTYSLLVVVGALTLEVISVFSPSKICGPEVFEVWKSVFFVVRQLRWHDFQANTSAALYIVGADI